MNWSLETLVVALGTRPDPLHGSVTTPIYQTSTFAPTAPGVYDQYDYTRTDNPTRTVLQEMFAAVEGAKYGLAFASGMAAEDCVMSSLNSGDHVVTSDDGVHWRVVLGPCDTRDDAARAGIASRLPYWVFEGAP